MPVKLVFRVFRPFGYTPQSKPAGCFRLALQRAPYIFEARKARLKSFPCARPGETISCVLQ